MYSSSAALLRSINSGYIALQGASSGLAAQMQADFSAIVVQSASCCYEIWLLLCRVLAVQTQADTRRNILADLLTVYANAGKTIVFTQTKREADEVAAGIAGVIPSEVYFGLNLLCSPLCRVVLLHTCQMTLKTCCSVVTVVGLTFSIDRFIHHPFCS